MKIKVAYFGESWFNPAQEALRLKGTEAMKANPTIDWDNSFVPIDHQYKGLLVSENPELLADKEWQLATFNADVQGMNNSDIVVAMYDPKMENSDPGVVWELGYAYGLHKAVYVVLPDEVEEDMNLMPAMGATQIMKVSDLATFDFNKGVYAIFDGAVY